MVATYDVILATMLVGGRPTEADTILKAGSDYLARVSWEMAYALFDLPLWLPHPASRQMRTASAQMRGAVAAIIARRRAGRASDLPAAHLPASDLIAACWPPAIPTRACRCRTTCWSAIC
jgi:cytochrome P450